MQYDVICYGNFQEFISSVNAALKEGWELQGGVAIVEYEYDSGNGVATANVFAQAVVKKD